MCSLHNYYGTCDRNCACMPSRDVHVHVCRNMCMFWCKVPVKISHLHENWNTTVIFKKFAKTECVRKPLISSQAVTCAQMNEPAIFHRQSADMQVIIYHIPVKTKMDTSHIQVTCITAWTYLLITLTLNFNCGLLG